MLADRDVIIFVYEVPFIFWHYINVGEVSWITLKTLLQSAMELLQNCNSFVYFKVRWTVITNCDSFFITKWDTVYYILRQVLQSAINLLQIATGITKCDDYNKLRQYSPSLPILHLITLGKVIIITTTTIIILRINAEKINTNKYAISLLCSCEKKILNKFRLAGIFAGIRVQHSSQLS